MCPVSCNSADWLLFQFQQTEETMLRLMAVAAALVFLAGCGSDSKTEASYDVSVEGPVVRITPPEVKAGLLVSVEQTEGEQTIPPVRNVYRDGQAFTIRLPEGTFCITARSLGATVNGSSPAPPELVDTVTVQKSTIERIALSASKLPRVKVAELPEHTGKAVRVRGVAGDAKNPLLRSLGAPLNAEAYPGTFTPPRFADETAAIVAPKVYARMSSFPPAFVKCSAVAVYRRTQSPIYPGGPEWDGHTLFIYALEPDGLWEPPDHLASKIARDWNGASPLPRSKDRALSEAWLRSRRFLERNTPTGANAHAERSPVEP
jgi:hypothetical protein